MKAIVLLPTYNERENIIQIVPTLFSVLPPGTQVMVIDDNSPDGTAQAVQKLQKQYSTLILFSRQKKEGLGAAYLDAFKKILIEFPHVDTVITMDADLSHDPYALPAMIANLSHADMVIGSRYISNGRTKGWEWYRQLLSIAGNQYVRFFMHIPLSDVTSGFISMRKSVLEKIPLVLLDPSGYAFLIALKYACWKQGVHMHEHPITFYNRRSGESKISMRIIAEGLLLPFKLLLKKNYFLKRTSERLSA